jgi:predicted nucleic acid-binding protein
MSRCAKAERILLSGLCAPEIISAFRRLIREKRITEDVYHVLKKDFYVDSDEAIVAEPGREILLEAVDCVERTGIKASDAVHIVTALKLSCDLFMTADLQQGKAARTMGLRCEIIPNEN